MDKSCRRPTRVDTYRLSCLTVELLHNLEIRPVFPRPRREKTRYSRDLQQAYGNSTSDEGDVSTDALCEISFQPATAFKGGWGAKIATEQPFRFLHKTGLNIHIHPDFSILFLAVAVIFAF